MEKLTEVQIDKEGKFKYILVRVWKEGKVEDARTIVYGTKEAEFHPDILAKVEPVLTSLGLQHSVQGGGKILHSPTEKLIKVFSKSTGFGRADHSVTVEILRRYFQDYTDISWTDED